MEAVKVIKMHFAHILYDAIIHILCPLNDLITNLKQNISNCFCWTWRPVDFCCSLTCLTWWLQGYKHCFSSYGVFVNLNRNLKVYQWNMYEYRHLDQSFSNCIKSINKSIDGSSKTKFRHIMSGNATLILISCSVCFGNTL